MFCDWALQQLTERELGTSFWKTPMMTHNAALLGGSFAYQAFLSRSRRAFGLSA
jgi:hypothetical protein